MSVLQKRRSFSTIPCCRRYFRQQEEEATEQMVQLGPSSPAGMAAYHRVHALRALQADLVRLVDDPKMLRAARERRRRFSQ